MEPQLPRPAPPRSVIDRVRDWVVWFGAGRLAASAIAVIAVVAGGAWLLRSSPTRPEDTLPLATRSTVTTTVNAIAEVSTVAPKSTAMVVHVAGAVASPGVYTVAPSARVTDAVSAAGGVVAEADPNAINLAAPLHDGERVYVPKVGETVAVAQIDGTGGGPDVPAGPVNVNSATAEQLDVLPGVGPATAAAIVAHRRQHGPFSSVDQLGDVRGIGPAKLEALRGLVTL
jgi:competence protein ComEA